MKLKIPKLIQLTTPRWVKKIGMRESLIELSEKCIVNGKQLDIKQFNCCIVGETLNLFNKNYVDFEEDPPNSNLSDYQKEKKFHKGCADCVEFSREFHRIIVVAPSEKYLEETLKDYAKHLKTNHKNIITKAEKKEARRLGKLEN